MIGSSWERIGAKKENRPHHYSLLHLETQNFLKGELR